MAGQNLKKALETFLTPEELAVFVRGFDMVGDIGIIIIPDELVVKERQIGEALLAQNRALRVVAKRVGTYGGEFRTIELEKIAGEGELETIHREYGLRLRVRPSDVYFSPRSNTERARIAALVRRGEQVLVMFSGIAPLPLMISAHSEAKKIVAIEKNPAAHELALQNLKLNKRLRNITLYCGDAGKIPYSLDERFDRVAMVLPSGAEAFVGAALHVLKENGTLHFYDFMADDDADEVVCTLTAAVEATGRKVVLAEVVKCGHVAPGKYRVSVDAVIA